MSENVTSTPARRILLVEDDHFLRKAAQTSLTRRGYHVVTASDGEEALRLVRTERPELILLDLIMPRIQGFEVLRTLKADADTAAIPVIVLSNLGQDHDREAALAAGAIAHIVKANISLVELVAEVDRALAAKA
ncbi:MAG: response regulator [Vicinamibacterales bacterium]